MATLTVCCGVFVRTSPNIGADLLREKRIDREVPARSYLDC